MSHSFQCKACMHSGSCTRSTASCRTPIGWRRGILRSQNLGPLEPARRRHRRWSTRPCLDHCCRSGIRGGKHRRRPHLPMRPARTVLGTAHAHPPLPYSHTSRHRAHSHTDARPLPDGWDCPVRCTQTHLRQRARAPEGWTGPSPVPGAAPTPPSDAWAARAPRGSCPVGSGPSGAASPPGACCRPPATSLGAGGTKADPQRPPHPCPSPGRGRRPTGHPGA